MEELWLNGFILLWFLRLRLWLHHHILVVMKRGQTLLLVLWLGAWLMAPSFCSSQSPCQYQVVSLWWRRRPKNLMVGYWNQAFISLVLRHRRYKPLFSHIGGVLLLTLKILKALKENPSIFSQRTMILFFGDLTGLVFPGGLVSKLVVESSWQHGLLNFPIGNMLVLWFCHRRRISLATRWRSGCVGITIQLIARPSRIGIPCQSRRSCLMPSMSHMLLWCLAENDHIINVTPRKGQAR